MTKKVSIIGSNGYLGRNLTWFLNQLGVELYCYDLQPKSDVENVFYQTTDITNFDQVSSINFDVDLIFLFAGLTGTSQSFSDYNSFFDVNQKGIVNILTHMKNRASNARIVFPSTRLVYKGIKDTPLSEDSEKEPKTIYALTKLACEETLALYQKVFSIDYTVFRICIPYGNLFPGDFSYGTIGFFIKKAKAGENICLFGDGLLKRTFTHIYDICSIIFDASCCNSTINQTYNIGGETKSLKDIAFLVSQKYGVEVCHIPWPEFEEKIESGDTIFDDTKLFNTLKSEIKHKYFSDWLFGNE